MAAHAQPITCQKPFSITVVGLGYIGLPTAAVLAQQGHQVLGVDIRSEVVDTINRGEIHIHEPHLGELVQHVVRKGNLRAALQAEPADVFFICVPTPMTAEHAPDVSYVAAAARSIRSLVGRGNLVILESTSPPGTTRDVVVKEAIPQGLVPGRDVFVAYCPERVLPGRILQEVVENDRVVGGMTPACAERTAKFYQSFVQGEVLTTDAITAEMTKLVENSYRDVNIAFANELSMLAERFGANPFEIIKLANRHPRVNVLSPGPGVGGHCISVDPWFLAHASPAHTPLIQAARQVNDAKPHFVVRQILAQAQHFESPRIGCLGLTYKADVDDIRESPSLEIVRLLQESGVADVLACDPFVPESKVPDIRLVPFAHLLEHCDVLALLTNHTQFHRPSAHALVDKRVVDTHGVWAVPATGQRAAA